MNDQSKIHVLSRAVIIDQAHILLCKTLTADPSFYFLPGGHLEHGESVQQALLRELKEETGVSCSIKRFLGCLEYSFDPGNRKICHDQEYNFVFEVSAALLKVSYEVPRLEPHIALVWIPLKTLSTIDFKPESFKTLIAQWCKAPASDTFKSKMR